MPLSETQARDLWLVEPLQRLSVVRQTRLRQDAQWLALGRGSRLPFLASPPSVFLVRTGTICVGLAGASNLTAGFARRDSLIGALVLDQMSVAAEARVHERATLIAIPGATLEQLADDCPPIRDLLTCQLLAHVRRVQQLASRLAVRSGSVRVARALLDLAKDHGLIDAREHLLPFHLSQRDLAAMTGLSRETVNGALSSLRRRRIVSIEAGRFRINLAAVARE